MVNTFQSLIIHQNFEFHDFSYASPIFPKLPDGTLCFDGVGAISWTVICEDGSTLTTIPVDYNNFETTANTIIGYTFEMFRECKCLLDDRKANYAVWKTVTIVCQSDTADLCCCKLFNREHYLSRLISFPNIKMIMLRDCHKLNHCNAFQYFQISQLLVKIVHCHSQTVRIKLLTL